MEEIKAIETVYDGYRFRSRLEARWAVFFNEMGIEYEYEPEGFFLSDGTKYLPDFYLHDLRCYFEVKRKGIKGTEEGKIAMAKIECCSLRGPWAGIICFGDPMDDDIYIFCQESNEGSGGSYEQNITIGLHPETREPYLFAYNDMRDRSFYAYGESDLQYIPMITTEYGTYKYDDFVVGRVIRARELARQARFEHGEKPETRTVIERKK